MTSGRRLPAFLMLMIAALIAASLYTSAIIRERQEAFAQTFRYNVDFSVSQAVIEFQRLKNALAELRMLRTADAAEEARLRLDILFNRLDLFETGLVGAFMKADPTRMRVLADFQEVVTNVEAAMSHAATGESAARALAIMAPLESGLIRVVSQAHSHAAELVNRDQRELGRLHDRFSLLTSGLIALGLGLVAVLTWNNRLLSRAHRELGITTAELRRAAADLSSANEAVATANAELRQRNALLIENRAALRVQNGLFDAALNNMSQGLCMFDEAMQAIVFNRQFERLFGVDSTAGSAVAETGRKPSIRDMAPDLADKLKRNMRRNRPVNFEIECKDGRIIAAAQQPMAEGDWVATFEDVTEQRRAQARIAHMARHDGLTNLPNRYAFREGIQAALDSAQTTGVNLAVMCLDLDHFKKVNDTLGHPTGDALLRAVAKRLQRCLRSGDLVARFGGDEFAILQSDATDPDDTRRLAERITEKLQKPFLIGGETIHVAGSLGIALSPAHGVDADVLLRNADLALYAAKADGRRVYRFYEESMNERLAARSAMERDLHLALERGELDLHYQPIVNMQSSAINGFEALLRWTHPVRGAVPPSTFIPIAEDSGLILQMGRWILQRACADAASWPRPVKLSVNLSAAQFQRGDIHEEVAAALALSGLPAERLIIEITESLLLSDSERTLDALHRLQALGVHVAMDDFGTGYSSLSYLRKYPFDRIKIDRSFVKSSSLDETGAAIIRTIVQLGLSLGMTTTAEGVETSEDREMLLAAGCREGQGYLFSPPVPREMVHDLMDTPAQLTKVA